MRCAGNSRRSIAGRHPTRRGTAPPRPQPAAVRRPAILDCRTGEAERLPIDDASVDYSFANMFLHHVERPAVAIAEMARILKPGGIVVITDLDTYRHIFLRDEHHGRWMGFPRREIRTWFRDAGLADVRVADLGDRCRATSTCGVYASISIFIASGLKR